MLRIAWPLLLLCAACTSSEQETTDPAASTDTADTEVVDDTGTDGETGGSSVDGTGATGDTGTVGSGDTGPTADTGGTADTGIPIVPVTAGLCTGLADVDRGANGDVEQVEELEYDAFHGKLLFHAIDGDLDGLFEDRTTWTLDADGRVLVMEVDAYYQEQWVWVYDTQGRVIDHWIDTDYEDGFEYRETTSYGPYGIDERWVDVNGPGGGRRWDYRELYAYTGGFLTEVFVDWDLDGAADYEYLYVNDVMGRPVSMSYGSVGGDLIFLEDYATLDAYGSVQRRKDDEADGVWDLVETSWFDPAGEPVLLEVDLDADGTVDEVTAWHPLGIGKESFERTVVDEDGVVHTELQTWTYDAQGLPAVHSVQQWDDGFIQVHDVTTTIWTCTK